MKNLKLILLDICKELNLSISLDEAINKGSKYYLELDYNPYYGGYRLVNVNVTNGENYGAFVDSSACARKSLKEMTAYLEVIFAGIKSTQNY